jgi:uncharacterized protein (TIGR02145 family)
MNSCKNLKEKSVRYFKPAAFFIIILTGLYQHCTDQTEQNISELLSIKLIAHDVSAFQGADGSIEIEITGGISPYRYNWSNGETTKDIDGLSAGTYSVIVNDAVDSTAAGSVKINQPIPENILVDTEGNFYTTVVIGNQTWMQQNLRVTVTPDSIPVTSYVYDNDPEKAATYGRLYTWDVLMNGSTQESAQGLCPVGWHVPSDPEWKNLEMELGMTRTEADISNSWRGSGIGTSLRKGGASGYEALYSGRYIGFFDLLEQYEYIWTSTESGQNAWRRCLSSGSSLVGRYNTFPKTYAFSVRCVKDN